MKNRKRDEEGLEQIQALAIPDERWEGSVEGDIGQIEEPARRQKRKIAVAVAGTAVAVASSVCVGAALGLAVLANSPQTVAENDGESLPIAQTSDLFDPSTIEKPHMHLWIPEYDLVEKEAETHLVDKEAVLAEETTLHTVCNVCGERIDGRTVEHGDETGHLGYTTDVPIVDQVEIEPAKIIEVVDVPASEHLEVVSERCPICGETRSPEKPA